MYYAFIYFLMLENFLSSTHLLTTKRIFLFEICFEGKHLYI